MRASKVVPIETIGDLHVFREEIGLLAFTMTPVLGLWERLDWCQLDGEMELLLGASVFFLLLVPLRRRKGCDPEGLESGGDVAR